MTYQAIVEPIAERTLKISQSDSTGRHHRIQYRGATRELAVKRIPTTALVYRMANMRTTVMQQSAIRSLGASPDYFLNGEENQEAQDAQHRILVEMAKDPTADIYLELGRRKEQLEPLLITVTGVVVNGNRRLASIRELFASDPGEYSRFAHVEVAVMPEDATEDDLSEIETRLQIAPDLRSEYGWVEEALGLRDQTTRRNWSLDKAAAVWGQTKQILQERLQQLAFAESYLDHIGHPGEYSRVKDAQQAITTFLKAQKNRVGVDPSELEAERLVMFAVLSNDVQSRKYDYARDIQQVAKRVITQIQPTGPSPALPAKQDDPNDPLAELMPTSTAIPGGLLDTLRDVSRSGEVAELAEEALADYKAENVAARRGQQLLDGVKGALQKVSGLQLTDSGPSTYLAALNQLVSLGVETTRLIRLILAEDASLSSEVEAARRDELIDAFQNVSELLES